ncbi:polysaccharide biosynthesis/export family protein [Simiduia agarivorans]|uniref:Cold shock protein n=1 Tax=Simiduia agarivorans (strain DSM 21679 / JCM 13881 / BCRC 17597 / SA1) TaxID=1117647 RepID=K4KNW5_SIMAS|nr:polysaccharide biosynthesis/export family protein [Simiduia agarivorans]AFU99803.1 cold shock protein [Simiduia agarivorans SA1 = DSM 21679]
MLTQRLPLATALLIAAMSGLVACTQHHSLPSPDNPSDKFYGTRHETGEHVSHAVESPRVYASNLDCSAADSRYQTAHFRADRALIAYEAASGQTQVQQIFNRELPLSPGDLIDVQIEDGEGFAGHYIVNPDGSLKLPHLSALDLQGASEAEASRRVEMALVRAGLFLPATARVSVRVLQWAPVEVTVTGAVFEPGRVRINENNQESVIADRVAAFGDYAERRSLVEALRAASGIRPDAKLDQVVLVRNGWQLELDMSGVFTGEPVRDVALVAGDQIVVPTTGCFQPQLVRPSQITPKGFRVFMSNLIAPALDNASAAVGRYSSSLPYGTRLLQAAVSANCVGGTQLTNAPRKVVLASLNPLTGQMQVVERSVEQLMRNAHREDINPYLMPNDALACYDSDVTNLRDFARSLTDLIAPVRLLM